MLVGGTKKKFTKKMSEYALGRKIGRRNTFYIATLVEIGRLDLKNRKKRDFTT